jgi:FMN-dependent oxidoreductase (nitrilotriacetate monooxygenase family)
MRRSAARRRCRCSIPLIIVPAMAAVTRELGFGITANLSYEAPYLFARRMSTLDHLTGGRIGWNVVTGYLDSAARAMGLERQMRHDDRYDLAEEYMEVVYRLWEESWGEGAVLRDRAGGRYADPAAIRRIRHEGAQYRLDAYHLCEPSPQRTPVLYQAGASARGQVFAARHAECVFLNGGPAPDVARVIAELRARRASRAARLRRCHARDGANRKRRPRTSSPNTGAIPAWRARWRMRAPRSASISAATAWTSRSRRGRATPSSPTSRR